MQNSYYSTLCRFADRLFVSSFFMKISDDILNLIFQLTSLLGEIGLDIEEAHAFSTNDGYSLDVFVVVGWHYEVLPRSFDLSFLICLWHYSGSCYIFSLLYHECGDKSDMPYFVHVTKYCYYVQILHIKYNCKMNLHYDCVLSALVI